MDNLKRIEILYLKALIPEMLILEIPAKFEFDPVE